MRGTNRTIWVVVGVCLVVGTVIGRLLYAWATVGNLAALLGWIMMVAFAGALILFVGIGGIIAAAVVLASRRSLMPTRGTARVRCTRCV